MKHHNKSWKDHRLPEKYTTATHVYAAIALTILAFSIMID